MPSTRKSASYKVGTPAMKFGLCLRSRSAYVLGVNCGTRMHVPPCIRIVWMLTPRPKPWNIGMIESILSPTS